MLDVAHRTAYNEDHEAFRDTVRKVFAEHMEPFLDDHEADGLVPRAAWKALGEAGMLCALPRNKQPLRCLRDGCKCAVVAKCYAGTCAS